MGDVITKVIFTHQKNMLYVMQGGPRADRYN